MRPVPQRVVLRFALAGLCLAGAFVLELGRLTGQEGAALTGAGVGGAGLGGGATDTTVGDAIVGDASDVTGSIGSGSRQRLPLTDEQRGHVFDDIMRLANTPVAHVPAPDEATVIPRSVALQELPEKATRDVPEVAGYKFVKLEEWILLVSPADRSVVAEMPRYHTVFE